ncbi:MAG: hypothetical protein ACON4W_05820 [Parvibaculales bacterium]
MDPMDPYLKVFDNSWSYVQIIILLTVILLVLGVAWLIYRLVTTLTKRWLAFRLAKKDLPPDTLMAIQRRGDRLVVTIHKDAVIEPRRLADMLRANSGDGTPALVHDNDDAADADAGSDKEPAP